MNDPITSTEIEALIKKISPKTKAQDQKASQEACEEVMPILLKLFQKISEEGTLPNSFYEATVTLILKPDKDNTKKKTTGQYN